MTSAIPINTAMIYPPARTSRAHNAAYDFHKTVDRAFITALLLTASVERAEAAILKSSRLMNLDTPCDVFFRGTVNAALETQCESQAQTPGQLEHASSTLPPELRPVLRLSSGLRQCFVLRVLMGLPREACARLLSLDIGQINERTCTAMLELPCD